VVFGVVFGVFRFVEDNVMVCVLVGWGGGGGGGRKAGGILLLYSTGLCSPPWRQFTSSKFVLCSACGFLYMKYVHSNPTYFFCS